MLSQLLSSKHKSIVVNLFLANPGRSFSQTELRMSTKCPSKLLIQTLRELSKMGFLRIFAKDKVKYYQVDKHFPLYPELVSMLRKSRKMPQDLLFKELSKLADCKVILLTGIFAGRPRIETDILIVGRVSEKRLSKPLKMAEKFAEQEVNYTVMPLAEFEYRKIMSDRFIKNILENSPVVVNDKTKNRSIVKLVERNG
jgi:hypothetical protein